MYASDCSQNYANNITNSSYEDAIDMDSYDVDVVNKTSETLAQTEEDDTYMYVDDVNVSELQQHSQDRTYIEICNIQVDHNDANDRDNQSNIFFNILFSNHVCCKILKLLSIIIVLLISVGVIFVSEMYFSSKDMNVTPPEDTAANVSYNYTGKFNFIND